MRRSDTRTTHQNVSNQTKTFGKEYLLVVVNSFSIITALAWNSAVQTTFEKISALNLIGPWIYAIIITLIAVMCTILTRNMNQTE